MKIKIWDRLKWIPILVCFMMCSCLSPGNSEAEMKVIIKEYSYTASDMDSKISCQTIAREQVKRIILEECGTYVAGKTEVKDGSLDSDKVSAITAGIVSIEIIDESWDGKIYWMKAKAEVDPETIDQAISNLTKDQGQVAELESTNKRMEELAATIEELKAKMASNENKEAQIEELKYKKEEQDNQDAQIAELTARIDANDKDAQIEELRAELEAKNYQRAQQEAQINELKSEIEAKDNRELQRKYAARYNEAVNEARSMELVRTSYVYMNNNRYSDAVVVLDRAREINPTRVATPVYIARSVAYEKTNNHESAMKELDAAAKVDRNPVLMKSVALRRASIYEKRGDKKRALDEINRAIKIDPRSTYAYNQRAGLYNRLGDKIKAKEDMKKAQALQVVKVEERRKQLDRRRQFALKKQQERPGRLERNRPEQNRPEQDHLKQRAQLDQRRQQVQQQRVVQQGEQEQKQLWQQRLEEQKRQQELKKQREHQRHEKQQELKKQREEQKKEKQPEAADKGKNKDKKKNKVKDKKKDKEDDKD